MQHGRRINGTTSNSLFHLLQITTANLEHGLDKLVVGGYMICDHGCCLCMHIFVIAELAPVA